MREEKNVFIIILLKVKIFFRRKKEVNSYKEFAESVIETVLEDGELENLTSLLKANQEK